MLYLFLISGFCASFFAQGMVRQHDVLERHGVTAVPVSAYYSGGNLYMGTASSSAPAMAPSNSSAWLIPERTQLDRSGRRSRSGYVPMVKVTPLASNYGYTEAMRAEHLKQCKFATEGRNAKQVKAAIAAVVTPEQAQALALTEAHVTLNQEQAQLVFAREEAERAVQHCDLKTYTLDETTRAALQQAQLNPVQFTEFRGTPVQQVLHQQVMSVSVCIAQSKALVSECEELKPLQEMMQRSLYLANTFKEFNKTKQGFCCIDAIYKIGDFTQRYSYAISKGLVKGTTNVTIRPLVSVGKGLKNFVFRPLESTGHLISSFSNMCAALARMQASTVYVDLTDDPDLFEAMMKYQNDLGAADAEQFRAWAHGAIETFKNKTGEEKAEAAAELFAEWFGPGLLGKGLGAVAKMESVASGLTQGLSVADKILEKPAAYMRRYTKYFSRVGYAAEVAEVGSSERIFLALAEIEDALPGSVPTLFEEGKIVGDIAKLSSAVQELVPELVEAAKVVTSKVEPYLCRDLKHLKWHDAMPAAIKDVACIPEFKTLAQKFDGMAHNLKEIGAKRITFKYGHTFLPDIVCERASRVSVGGFHHDYLGKIEKTGILNITKIAENAYGCYKIEWSYLNSRAKNSTMFPQWWPREKVMTSIQEAVNNTYFYRLQGVEHVFQGKCAAGFDIRFVIDAGGTVVSAYPLM